jgi:hypothetical protein
MIISDKSYVSIKISKVLLKEIKFTDGLPHFKSTDKSPLTFLLQILIWIFKMTHSSLRAFSGMLILAGVCKAYLLKLQG